MTDARRAGGGAIARRHAPDGGKSPAAVLRAAAVLRGAAVLGTLVMTASCTGTQALPSTLASTVPAADEQAIRATLQRVNATAGGPVSNQQQVLADLVDPGSAAALHRCPRTTATLRFEPVYQGLRSAPDWRPAAGSLTGTVYALPALIRIYTGDRVTGTDLTTLHLAVQGGEASLTALCVS